MLVGLRPEECSLRPAQEEQPSGEVKVVEPLGNVSDVTVDLGSALFVVRVPGFTDLTVGDRVVLGAERATVHCFDATSGQRLTSADH